MLPSIAERRKQLKQDRRNLERRLAKAKEQLSLLENQTYLLMSFKSVASDKKGRQAEYEMALTKDGQRSALRNEIFEYECQIEDIEDLISSINFKQRERLAYQMSTIPDQIEKFTGAVTRFEAAVERFSLARKH